MRKYLLLIALLAVASTVMMLVSEAETADDIEETADDSTDHLGV